MQNFDSCYGRGYYTTFSRRASDNVHISNKKLGHFKRISWTMYTHDSFNLRWTFSIFKKVFACGYFNKTWQAWLRLKKATFYSRNYWGNVSLVVLLVVPTLNQQWEKYSFIFQQLIELNNLILLSYTSSIQYKISENILMLCNGFYGHSILLYNVKQRVAFSPSTYKSLCIKIDYIIGVYMTWK